jgi:hypothetical protein
LGLPPLGSEAEARTSGLTAAFRPNASIARNSRSLGSGDHRIQPAGCRSRSTRGVRANRVRTSRTSRRLSVRPSRQGPDRPDGRNLDTRALAASSRSSAGRCTSSASRRRPVSMRRRPPEDPPRGGNSQLRSKSATGGIRSDAAANAEVAQVPAARGRGWNRKSSPLRR